jgi:FkbM family methyltransferase
MRAVTNQLMPLMKQAGLYRRLKASALHDLYWRMTDRRWIDERSREIDFYRNLLTGFRPGDLIFDVGANDGAKVDVFLRLRARVIAIEPDEMNQKVLRDKFLRYRLFPKPVLIIDKAASDKNTIETFWIDGPGSAVNTMNPKWVQSLKNNKANFAHTHFGLDFERRKDVETVTLDDLIRRYGTPFFLKIDVEGYETNVLHGLTSPVPFVSFEVNLPDFKPEGLECINILRGIAPGGAFNFAADCRKGLMLQRWLGAEEFSRELDSWSDGTVEVFWKSCQPNIR